MFEKFENMSDDELSNMTLGYEEGAIEEIPDMTLEELIVFYQTASAITLPSSEYLTKVMNEGNETSRQVYFSIFRFLKALLAEIEYRIRENKI